MPLTTCRHIKINGKRCQSPTLVPSAFCYFHSHLHRRHKHLLETSFLLVESAPSASGTARSTPESAPPQPIELDLSPVKDAESIQVSISLLIAALARNRIDPKRAAVLLYALQLASTNAKSITVEPYASSVTRAVTRTRRTRPGDAGKRGRQRGQPQTLRAPRNTGTGTHPR